MASTINHPGPGETHDPSRQNYVPAYEDTILEARRIIRCLQQQVEDSLTTLRRLEELAEGPQKRKVDTLYEGLRCWRIALSQL